MRNIEITGIKPKLSENGMNAYSDIVVNESARTCVRDGRLPNYDYVVRDAEFMPLYAVKQFKQTNPKTGMSIEIKGAARFAQIGGGGTTHFTVNLPDAKIQTPKRGKYDYIVSDKDNNQIFGFVKIPYDGYTPNYSALREKTEGDTVVYSSEYVEHEDGTGVFIS